MIDKKAKEAARKKRLKALAISAATIAATAALSTAAAAGATHLKRKKEQREKASKPSIYAKNYDGPSKYEPDTHTGGDPNDYYYGDYQGNSREDMEHTRDKFTKLKSGKIGDIRKQKINFRQ
jgi:hypothetical protein